MNKLLIGCYVLFLVGIGFVSYTYTKAENTNTQAPAPTIVKSSTSSSKPNNPLAEEITKPAVQEPTKSTSVPQPKTQAKPNPTVQPQPAPVKKEIISKPYIPGVCTNTPIPYKTIYKEASWLDVGKTENGLMGLNGYVRKCTADSNGKGAYESTVPAIDRVIYQGTNEPIKPVILEPIPSGPSPEEKNQKILECIQKIQAISPNSSAYMQCYTL